MQLSLTEIANFSPTGSDNPAKCRNLKHSVAHGALTPTVTSWIYRGLRTRSLTSNCLTERTGAHLPSVCFAGVQKRTDAALRRLLAFVSVWNLEVDSTMLFPHCQRQ